MSEFKRIPIVVFTGAGASRAEPICLPTMFEFFQQIMNENRQPKSARITNKTYFKFIFDAIYGDNDNYDLERIMDALYHMTDFTKSDNWGVFMHPEIYDNVFNAVTSRIPSNYYAQIKSNIQPSITNTFEKRKKEASTLARELEDLIREKYEDISFENIQKVYAHFFEWLTIINKTVSQAPIIPFFTTNYDMSIDWFFYPRYKNERAPQQKWLRTNNINMIDGFINQEWDSQNFDVINEADNAGVIFIPYYKLHGSLYWEEVAGTLRRNSTIARDPHLQQKLMIIYPSDKKLLTQDPYYFSHRALDSYLARTDNLLIIGFSFRDPAIVQSFQYALNYNRGLSIHIVIPTGDSEIPGEVADFINVNNGRVKHINKYFGNKDCLDAINQSIGLIPEVPPAVRRRRRVQ